jgi:hypothetical protein
MACITQYETVNETALLEWADKQNRELRMFYSNCFYGSCTLTAQLTYTGTRLIPDEASFSFEDQQVNHGDATTLRRVSKDFLRQFLSRDQALSLHRLAGEE